MSDERVAGVRRRGKYAVVELGSGRALVTSLRMTGRLVVVKHGAPEYPGTHVLLRFKDGSRLSFADVRTLGRMRLVDPGEAWDRELGVEPLSSGFTQEAFIGMLAGRKTPIKALLLDQRRIAGIGNIYACEALWEAGIRPSRPARALTKARVGRLHHAIVDVLERAIEMRGTSVDDYVDADGLQGGFQNKLSVYGKGGQVCPRCGAAQSSEPCSHSAERGGAGAANDDRSKNKFIKVGNTPSLQPKSHQRTKKKINSRSNSASTKNPSRFSTRAKSSPA